MNTFLDALAETSHIQSAAKFANVPVSTIYAERARNPEFARRWQSALFEGYTNLEMEVLGALRSGRGKSEMDVPNALRLLAAHRDSYARERARRRNVSAADVRASIERKVEALRKQVAARQEKGRGS